VEEKEPREEEEGTEQLPDPNAFAQEVAKGVIEEFSPLLKPVESAPTIIVPGADKAVNHHRWFTKRINPETGKSAMLDEGWYERRKVANDWIRAMWKNEPHKIFELASKGLVEGTDASGGYLVPEEFVAEIVYYYEKYGLARRMCRNFPMKHDTLRIPRATSTTDVYWTGEAVAKTASTPAFGEINLFAKKAAAYTILSDELVEDSSVDLVAWLSEQYANAFAYAEDYQLFRGTGTPFVGILNNSSVNTVDMTGDLFSDILLDELLDLINAVGTQYEDGAAFFMHKQAMTYLRKLKEGTTGAYILDRPAQSGLPPTLWGYPVYRTSVLPHTTAVSTEWVIFGNLKYAFFGDRKKMTADILDQATLGSDKLGEQDERALRVVERVAITVAVPEAFATLKTAAS